MRNGTNRQDGTELDGWVHCLQSVNDILSTRIGTRVMRRSYGSDCPDLIDKPGTNDIVLEMTMAMGDAISKWEPSYVFRGVGITGIEGLMTGGVFQIDIIGDFYPRGHLGDFTVVENDRGMQVSLARSF